MKFPNLKNSGHIAAWRVMALLVLGFALASTGLAQKNNTRFNQIAQATQASAASLEQCRNGSPASATGCTTVGGAEGWVTGNAGKANSDWAETQYVAYRMLFTGLPTDGTERTVIIGYDVLKSGIHAIDYLGTYNITAAAANPCAGVSGCTFAANSDGDSQFLIPVDPDVAAFGAPFAVMPATGKFTMWGGTITSVAYDLPGHVGEERQITVKFTSTVSNPVLAWGGHIAWRGEWGNGNSAGGITGSPYHMRLISLDGSGGNQDRSLDADAVAATGVVEIIKEVVVDGTIFVHDAIFTFDPSSNFNGDANFQLQDNGNNGDGFSDTTGPLPVLNFDDPITVTEVPLSGWTLANVNCVEVAGLGFPNLQDSTKNTPGPATIIVQEGEFVTCTFTNTRTTPTAAPASVVGRVLTSGGRGVAGARITMWDTSTGELVTRTTNNFGYYRFDNLSVSHFYVASVDGKGMSFANSTRSFTLENDLVGLNFFAN